VLQTLGKEVVEAFKLGLRKTLVVSMSNGILGGSYKAFDAGVW
jgi:hypothetical protein